MCNCFVLDLPNKGGKYRTKQLSFIILLQNFIDIRQVRLNQWVPIFFCYKSKVGIKDEFKVDFSWYPPPPQSVNNFEALNFSPCAIVDVFTRSGFPDLSL